MKKNLLFLFLMMVSIGYLEAQTPINTLLKRAQENISVDLDTALWYAQAAQDQAEAIGDSMSYTRALNLVGIVRLSSNAYKEAATIFHEVIHLFRAQGKTTAQVYAENNLALVYKEIGLYEKAAALHLDGLRYFESIRDTHHIVSIYNNLGIVYEKIRNYDLALEYYDKALTYTNKLEAQVLGTLYLNKGLLYSLKEDSEQALFYYNKALEPLQNANALDDIRKVYQNIALVYMTGSDLDSALFYQEKAYQIGKQFAQNDHIYYCNMGMIYFDQKEYNKALRFLQQAYTLKPTYGNREEFLSVLDGLSRTNAVLGNHQAALDYKIEEKALQDSLFETERIRQVQSLEIQYAVEQKEQQIATLNDSLELEQNKRLLAEHRVVVQGMYRNIAIGVVAISLLLMLLLLNRMSIRQKLVAARAASLEQQHKISELERQQLEVDLAHKERSLSNMALAAVQKNEMLDDLEDRLQTLVADHQSISVALKPIQKMLKKQVSIEEDWNQFKVHFEAVHPEFYKKLLAISTSLTQNDLRHCTYIKVKLDSKEIARIMGISPKSVQMSRYRIKKKLNLDKEEDLFVFIERL